MKTARRKSLKAEPALTSATCASQIGLGTFLLAILCAALDRLAGVRGAQLDD